MDGGQQSVAVFVVVDPAGRETAPLFHASNPPEVQNPANLRSQQVNPTTNPPTVFPATTSACRASSTNQPTNSSQNNHYVIFTTHPSSHGERVPYVVVYGEPGARLVDLAVAPQVLVGSEGRLRINGVYYITRQVRLGGKGAAGTDEIELPCVCGRRETDAVPPTRPPKLNRETANCRQPPPTATR
jgi:hypothetical protein